MNETGNLIVQTSTLSDKYDKLVPLLIKAIKDLKEEIKIKNGNN
jgi:hypothetical protein